MTELWITGISPERRSEIKGVGWLKPPVPTKTPALVSAPQTGDISIATVGRWLLTSSSPKHSHLWLCLQLKRKKKWKGKKTPQLKQIKFFCDLRKTSFSISFSQMIHLVTHAGISTDVSISPQTGMKAWLVGKSMCPHLRKWRIVQCNICRVFDFLSTNLVCLLSSQQ